MVERLGRACGVALLDTHVDADHHRAVFTLAGPGRGDAEAAARQLARAAAAELDLSEHAGEHPRIGAIDVVPFVALAGSAPADAVEAARRFADWISRELELPALLYGDADPRRRSLPEVRKLAATTQVHPLLGAVAVGARPVLVAVNCELDRDDVEAARRLAASVRERDGGLPGVRALAFHLASRRRAQVSMNLTALEKTGVERACTEVRERARLVGADVARVELVGLLPRTELERCTSEFRDWAGLTDDQTIEARLARQARAS